MRWDHDVSVRPLDCFAFDFEQKRSKEEEIIKAGKGSMLPSLSWLSEESDFATFWWRVAEEGVRFVIEVDKPVEKVILPQFDRGDSIELFIDTRDNKASKLITQYCHHFVVLPQPQEATHLLEVTRFHVYHKRERVDTSVCKVSVTEQKKKYKVELFLPKSALFGYDLSSYNKLGFTYKVNGFNRDSQYFVLSGRHYNIASHPHLWGSFLIK